MGNLEQISISIYPSKNYSKYPKSTLEHKWFLSKMLFCRSSVLRNLRFLAKKNAQIKKKRPSNLVLFNFKQLLFYDYPPKNASKYPKITMFKFTIFEKRPLRAPKTIFLTKSKCKSLQKYKIGIYIKFHAGCSNHLRGKTENLLGGGGIRPPPM